MTLTGIALLPPPEVARRLVDFQQEHGARIAGPRLGLRENLPHLTVLQCPVRATLDLDAALARLIPLVRPGIEPTLGRLFYQPGAWIFAHVTVTGGALQQLQAAAVGLCRGHIDHARIPAPDAGMTDAERAAHLAFGYRYLGGCYRPHFTMGRTPEGTEVLPAGLAAAFDATGLAGTSFRPVALAWYRAGESGCFAETLARVDL